MRPSSDRPACGQPAPAASASPGMPTSSRTAAFEAFVAPACARPALWRTALGAAFAAALWLAHRRRHPALRRPRRRVRHADRRAPLPGELRRARRRRPCSPPGCCRAAARRRCSDPAASGRAASALGVAVVAPRRDPVGRRAGAAGAARAAGHARGLGRPAAAGAAGDPRPVGGRGARLPRLPDAVARRPLPLGPRLVAAAGARSSARCTGTRPSSGRTPGIGVLIDHGDRPRPRRRHGRGPATSRRRSACISPTTSWRCSSSRCPRRSPASRSS